MAMGQELAATSDIDFAILDVNLGAGQTSQPIAELLREQLSPWVDDPWAVQSTLDLCTGSGCLAILAALAFPESEVDAIDISPDALDLAKQNAEHNELAGRVFWMRNHLLERFAPESADLIVANLPYISTENWKALAPSVREHEPRTALDSGPSAEQAIPSTVVKLEGESLTCLREGKVPFAEIEAVFFKGLER